MRRRVCGLAGLLTGLLVGMTPGPAHATPADASRRPQARAASFTVHAVPTSSASPGRIVTAPNGDLWFVERDANQVGRITPAGVITEFPLPPIDNEGWVMDLDVAPDGRVWVVYDQGRSVVALTPGGSVSEGPYSLGGAPYGEDVEVDAAGKVWITNSYDVSFIAWVEFGDDVYYSENSPPCDGALGAGTDGQMWCASERAIVRVDPDGAGGVTFPVPELPAVAYSTPNSLAPGPRGAIWFARHDGGTFVTSPNDGSIGYLTHDGSPTVIDTGRRTAPKSLVAGPGGVMWFTNVGADSAIGHYDPATGRGALSAVGAYSPSWLAVGADGRLWATDPSHNAILEVDPDSLSVTDVDPGPGTVLTAFPVGRPVVPARPVTVKQGKVKVKITCPASAGAGCRGTVVLRSSRPGRPALTERRTFRVSPGAVATGTLPLTAKGRRLLPSGRSVKVRQELAATGETRASAVATITVRR